MPIKTAIPRKTLPKEPVSSGSGEKNRSTKARKIRWTVWTGFFDRLAPRTRGDRTIAYADHDGASRSRVCITKKGCFVYWCCTPYAAYPGCVCKQHAYCRCDHWLLYTPVARYPGHHAETTHAVELLWCFKSLTQKMLEGQGLLIASGISDPASAHLTCLASPRSKKHWLYNGIPVIRYRSWYVLWGSKSEAEKFSYQRRKTSWRTKIFLQQKTLLGHWPDSKRSNPTPQRQL